MGREVHVVVLILLSIFEVWMCYQVLYRTVLDKKYLRTWQKVLIWVNILGVGTLMGINRNMFYFSHIMFWMQIIIVTLIVSVPYLYKWYIKLEIVVIYSSFIAILDFFFAFCGMIFLDHFWYSIYVYGNSPWKCFMFLLSRIVFFLILLFFGRIERREKILEGTQKFLIAVSCIFLILVKIYQSMIYKIMNGLSNIKGESAACSLVAIVTIFGFLIGLSWKYQELKKENQILAIREKLEVENLQDMRARLEDKRIQIHDMRHHIIVLKKYIAAKNYDSIEIYLNELLEGYLEIQEDKWTRIRNLDILLGEKKDEAEKVGINFQIKTDVLKKLPFSEPETSVLFGNLVDNSIEACKKIKNGSREISVEITQKKDFLFISIANTIGYLPKVKRGELISDKTDKESHGFGLKSVKRIVRKYHGTFEYEILERRIVIYMVFSNE